MDPVIEAIYLLRKRVFTYAEITDQFMDLHPDGPGVETELVEFFKFMNEWVKTRFYDQCSFGELEDDEDTLHMPHAGGRWENANILRTFSDDGDESHYGFAEWVFQDDNTVKLVDCWGRDTHDGGLEFDFYGVNPEWQKLASHVDVKVLPSIPEDVFARVFEKWILSWAEESEEYRKKMKSFLKKVEL